MAAQMAVIPNAASILVRTGNVVNWNRLKKKITQSPTEELSDVIQSTVSSWLNAADKNEIQYVQEIECSNQKCLETLPSETRDQIKLTVKIFLNELDEETLKAAINTVCADLGVDYIDQVLLSAQTAPKGNEYLDEVMPLYKYLEDLHDEEKVFAIGVSDLEKDTLELLYNAAQVKPIIDQVNLASCCVLPPELVDYAKENNIQLMTHNDPIDILPKESLQSMFKDVFTEKDSLGWQLSWVARYSIVVKCRGIINGKGYIAKASRSLHKSK